MKASEGCDATRNATRREGNARETQREGKREGKRKGGKGMKMEPGNDGRVTAKARAAPGSAEALAKRWER